jgi:hypothetical protein
LDIRNEIVVEVEEENNLPSKNLVKDAWMNIVGTFREVVLP